tara:strand:- start:1240 stop:1962 length:723 start_codon:yes stop_codon:yes gene_type:complete
MANQNNIDNASDQIADLVEKARVAMVTDLFNISGNVDDIDAFIKTLLDLDIEGTLKNKLQKATAVYANAHRQVLESTIGFASIESGALSLYATLNERLFDSTITRVIAEQIKNQVIKGVKTGLGAEAIIENVITNSISNAQMKTLVNTTLNTYSRQVTNEMMDIAPDNTKFVYIGPIDEKTRDVCREFYNAGKITQKEIKSKGEKWKNSLIDGGGYNCRHKWEIASSEGLKFYEDTENAG